MLQFNTTICTINARFAPRLCWRITALFTSSSTSVVQEPGTVFKQNHEPASNALNAEQRENFNKLKLSVYKSLGDNANIASKIQRSNNINDLLDLIKLPHLSQNEIVKVMDSIIKWVNENNVNTVDSQTNSSNIKKGIKQAELNNTSVEKKDDIIAKYSELSTVSMIQEVLKLAQIKRRNPRELKFLFDNINKYNEKLAIGQYASLMFSMAALSYIDEAFLDSMSSKLITLITNVKSNAVNSMVKSMSILKYKNTEFLSHICRLLIQSNEDIQTNYLLNHIQSMSLLGFSTEEVKMVIEKYASQLTIDTLGLDNWLNYVWYLLLLNCVQNSHVESVLNEEFLTTILSADTNYLQEIKLLNINGAAKYILKDYHGPLLNKDFVSREIKPQSADKMLYIESLRETLQSISPSPKCFNINVDTEMGFLLDAECYVDSKCNLTDPNGTSEQKPKPTKLAMLVHDYHSYCHGNQDIHGIIQLRERLLLHSGYKVVPISYKHFGLDDKLIKRQQFLKQRIQKLS